MAHSLTGAYLAKPTAELMQSNTEVPHGTQGPLDEAVTTSAIADPGASARHAAYQQRKDARAEARKTHSLPQAGAGVFLSNLPEVEDDIQFRFSFVVVGAGSIAQQVVQRTCKSLAAQKLSSSNAEASSRASRTATGAQSFHCLTALTSLLAGKAAAGENLTKLDFSAVGLCSNMPTCTSHLEALNTVMVFALTIDHTSCTQDSFKAQLQSLAGTIKHLRATTPVKLRPARALLLCSTSEDAEGRHPADAEWESWAWTLADFERTHGHTWKFGPLPLRCGDGLHRAFTEIASVQIARCQEDDPDDHARDFLGQRVGEPKKKEPEEHDGKEALGIERVLLEKKLQACNARSVKGTRARYMSEDSQGWQQPPVFEAEADGSEAGEDVVAMHANMCGTDHLRSTRRPTDVCPVM